MRRLLQPLLGLVLAACPRPAPAPDADAGECPGGSVASADGGCTALGWTDCGPGFVADPAGGCLEVAAEDCPNGTMPTLGSLDCTPVGWTTCPAGFELDPAGWACGEVLPASPCTGATREALGEAACVPLGDCQAPFPPAAATHFVDAAFTAGQLDANHFQTLGAAVAAAQAGAVIAVADGTYPELVDLTRPVSLVGRCAEKVRVDGAQRPRETVKCLGAKGAALKGLTVSGGQGVLAGDGCDLTLEDVLVADARMAGLWSQDTGTVIHARRVAIRTVKYDSGGQGGYGAGALDGARLELEDTVVESADDTGVGVFSETAAATASLVRTLVLDTNRAHASSQATGLWLASSAVDVAQTVVRGTRGTGILAQGAGCQVSLRESVVRDTTELTAQEGAGVRVADGCQATLDRSRLTGNVRAGVIVQTAGTLVTVTGSTLDQNLPEADGDFGVGVYVAQAGRADVTGSTLLANAKYGLHAEGADSVVRATATLVRSTQSTGAGVHGRALDVTEGALGELHASTALFNHDESIMSGNPGSLIRLFGVLVRDSQPRPSGVSGRGLGIFEGGAMEADGVAVVRAFDAAIFIDQPQGSPLGQATFRHLLVRDTLAAPNGQMSGTALANSGILKLSESGLVGSRSSGMAVAHPGSVATLENVTIRDTAAVEAAGESFRYGVLVLDHAVLQADGVDVARSGVGLTFAASAGTLSRSLVRENTVGLHVMEGTEIRQAPQAAPEPLTAVVGDDTLFLRNDLVSSSGLMALPPLPTR